MRRSFVSISEGFTHTVMAIPSRAIAIQSEEAIQNEGADRPKRNWVWDIHNPRHPYPLAPFPPIADTAALCHAGGRFGSHNIEMNRPVANSRTLTETVVGSYFNGGVRAYSIADPSHPVEIGYVDEHGLIYANDRLSGGLYVIRYTGTTKLR